VPFVYSDGEKKNEWYFSDIEAISLKSVYSAYAVSSNCIM